VPETTVLSVRRNKLNAAAVALIWLALFGFFVFRFTDGYVRDALVALVLATCALALRRAATIRIEVSAERVRIQNFVRRFDIAWRDVSNVGIGAFTQGPTLQPAFAFGLRDGRIITAQATPRTIAEQRQLAELIARWAPHSVTWSAELLQKGDV
jgi:hypothetical protein